MTREEIKETLFADNPYPPIDNERKYGDYTPVIQDGIARAICERFKERGMVLDPAAMKSLLLEFNATICYADEFDNGCKVEDNDDTYLIERYVEHCKPKDNDERRAT